MLRRLSATIPPAAKCCGRSIFSTSRRRTLITLSVLLSIPQIGIAQRTGVPVIGFLSSRARAESAHLLAAYHQGLAEAGYVEGKNVAIEYRWAEGRFERIAKFAEELVARKVAVISTLGGSVTALAAKAATAEIPIVFNSGGDLVKEGLVSSFRQPSGNITGISLFASLLLPKRLELLRDLDARAERVAILFNPKNPAADSNAERMRGAARTLGLKLSLLPTSTEEELSAALRTLNKAQVDALVVQADPFLDDRRKLIVDQAARQALPTICPWRDYVVAGGLMSYSADIADTYRQNGIYVGKILKGAMPSDLPVLQPSKFQLVVNLKTAKSLGVTIPQSVLVRADEIIR